MAAGHHPGTWSIRGAFYLLAASLSILVVLASTVLIASATVLRNTTNELAASEASVQVALELEIDLLLSSRERFLARLRPGLHHEQAALQVEAELDRWLATAERLLQSSREEAALRRLSAEVEAYRQAVEVTSPDVLADYERWSAVLDRSVAAAERLVEVNEGQARAARQRSRRWKTIAEAAGWTMAALMVVVVGGTVLFAGRVFYRPFFALQRAISAYGHGDRSARAPTDGPSEIQAIASCFDEMADTLERQRAAQLTFLAAVAHDLRNPLAALKLSAQLAERDATSSPERVLRRAEVVRRQVDRLHRMVDDLLEVSRIEAGQLELRRERADLREAVREAWELYRDASERHELLLELPPGPLPADYDPVRLGQVLANLMSNAIKYSPAGGEVRLVLRPAGDLAAIEVHDQGIGISPRELRGLFQPFRRGGGEAVAIPGVGLGLSVSRRLVEAHGGTIEVDSRPGVGSVFRVFLPRAGAADVAVAGEPTT